MLWESNEKHNLAYMNVAPPNFADWRERSRSFENMGVWRDHQSFTLTGQGAAEQVYGASMSHDLFEVLRVPAFMGRTFTDAEDKPGGPPVVVISHGFWRRWFGARSDVIGKTVEVNGVTCEVIGVMPPHFAFPLPVALEGVPAPKSNELWMPLATDLPAGQRGAHYLLALGRLAPGVDARRAEQELVGIAAQIAMEQIVSDSVSRPRFSALLLGIFAATALLLAAVGVYSVISQLVGQRTQEFGVRMALGASPMDVGRLVIGFGVRLAAIGVILGIPAAFAFSRVLPGLLYGVNAANPVTYGVVSAVLTIVATLAAVLPARRATRVDPLLALRAE